MKNTTTNNIVSRVRNKEFKKNNKHLILDIAEKRIIAEELNASERVICPNCKRSLRNLNAWHYCKEIAIDDLFTNKSDENVLAFDRLLQTVADWKDIEFSATKNCIVFVRNKTFLLARPMTKSLEIKFYANEPIEDEDLYKCQVWNSKYEGIIRVVNENQLKSKHFQYFKSSSLIS